MITTGPAGTDTSLTASAVSAGVDRPLAPRFSHRPRLLALLVLVAAPLVLVVVGAVAFSLMRSVHVELSIDGRSQPIDTRADSVADLLVDQGITVTGADLVDPPLEAELGDGDTVVVRYARPLTVAIDGSVAVHTTTELTVGDALRSLDAPLEGASVSLPLGDALPRAGASVEIVTPKPITLVVGGQPVQRSSASRTVGDLLGSEEIVLGRSDTVTPPVDTVVTEAMTITVTRIRVENETRTEPLPHDTVERDDPDGAVGTREVLTDGVDGSQEVTYSVTYTNDQVTSEQVLSSAVSEEPVTEVVAVGSKPVAVATADPGAPAGATAELNWAALAQCESSGNPTAVNPAGYYGLYQFSPATWASVGGSGNPADASPAEQTTRAQILYDRSGVGQWPHCGPRLFD